MFEVDQQGPLRIQVSGGTWMLCVWLASSAFFLLCVFDALTKIRHVLEAILAKL